MHEHITHIFIMFKNFFQIGNLIPNLKKEGGLLVGVSQRRIFEITTSLLGFGFLKTELLHATAKRIDMHP